MTHEQAIERLDELASGELPDIERRLLERHLEGCDACRAEVGAIRALLDDVAALPRGIAPPADLWQGIALRLEPREIVAAQPVAEETKVIPFAPRRRVWQPPRWALQAAAAVVLVVGSSAVTATLMRQQAAQGPIASLPGVDATAPGRRATAGTDVPLPAGNGARTVAAQGATAATQPVTALAAFRPAEREYQRAVDELQQVLETRRADLAPETVATLEHNLAIIDAAIADSRAALERDPNSRELTQMLSSTYDAKVRLLRNAVQL
ncbi:MAG TPA: zf-HC2 domain-containing protein [Longimicrobiaceae bacterium]|nr:zf-HC2 domain-containing protein [Longimicrobiaceae bacterium]